ncbi:F-box-like/WD repeat-containing protein TBL1XR1 [Termitomyces sp. T112]|nr:F-box-like/WD repeat-containing protein TBL1XR1 [Termitomyces sp. T112]KAH0591162.1 hypothetical protein H2248_001260 [Termitomyces sp. 'cryptogamus']
MDSSRINDYALRITADEVNCLIYSYLLDSGFTHSAFAVKMEGQLDRSPYASKHIQRGELIELLSKSLLYIEVESHWKNDALANSCKSSFSLLEPHVCSATQHANKQLSQVTSVLETSEDVQLKSTKSNGSMTDGASKRKESPISPHVEGPPEKRAKRDPDDMDLDTPCESRMLPDAKTNSILPDESTDPDAVLLLPGHKAEVFVCKFNPVNHELLATGSKDAIVNLWTIPKGTIPKPLEGLNSLPIPSPPISIIDFAAAEAADLTSLDWNADGTLVAIGSYDSIVRICTSTGELYFSHPQHRGPVFTTRFSKSGNWLLTASLDGTACLWDVKEKCLRKQYRCHTDCCLDVDWLDEDTFATCGADRLIHILRVNESAPFKTLVGHGNEINQIKCNRSQTRLASCSDDMTARVWNIDDLNNNDSIPGLVASDGVVLLQGHKHSVSTIGWCPDPTLGLHPILATSSFDSTARLWDSVTGRCLKVFSDHKRPVYTLSFSPNGRWLATGSGDGWMHIYSVLSHEKKWSWYAGPDRPGVYEIDWQVVDGFNRIALALERSLVAVIDVDQIPALQDDG